MSNNRKKFQVAPRISYNNPYKKYLTRGGGNAYFYMLAADWEQNKDYHLQRQRNFEADLKKIKEENFVRDNSLIHKTGSYQRLKKAYQRQTVPPNEEPLEEGDIYISNELMEKMVREAETRILYEQWVRKREESKVAFNPFIKGKKRIFYGTNYGYGNI